MRMDLFIRSYRDEDEENWLKCHALVYLNTNERRLLKKKPKYAGKPVELVATVNDGIIGFLDIELEAAPRSLCFKKLDRNGMLWGIGVLREYRRRGVATKLLNEGLKLGRKYGMRRLEAWTIEEEARGFYEKHGFKKFYEYYHILLDDREKLRGLDATACI